MQGNLAENTNEFVAACEICETPQPFLFEYQKHFYHRCGECGLVSTYPLPSVTEIEAHYARKFQSGNYSLVREYSKELSLGVFTGMARMLENYLKIRGQKLQGKSVLDIGCFTGEFLEILQKNGADVSGVELQTEAVEIANQKLGGKVYKADVFSDNFPNAKFDIITLLGLIEHVPMPMKLLGRVRELIKPGGVIMLQTPDSGSFLARSMGKFWMPYAPVEHIHLFSRRSLEKALTGLGFKNIDYRPHWKTHKLGYCYNQLQNFGPEFYKFFAPIYKITPEFVRRAPVPFYIGEMVMLAEA